MGSKKRPTVYSNGRTAKHARKTCRTLSRRTAEVVAAINIDRVHKEAVNHPAYYGGDTTFEVIKVLRAWGLDRCAYLFQVVKYVARAGKKDPTKEIEDLEKARFYLDEKIKVLTQDRHDMLVKMKLRPLVGIRP